MIYCYEDKSNDFHAQQINDDLAVPLPQEDVHLHDVQDAIQDMEVDQLVNDLEEGEQLIDGPLAHPEHPQDTISFDQSGTTANYLRQHGQDIE